MGRSSVQLFQGFPQEDRVTLHHEHRHALVSGLRSLGDGVVIIALHPDNPCATGRHGADPGRTNMGVHKDGGLGADELCAGRDREAVVAIGRAGPGHRGRSAPDLGALDFLRPASPNALASAGSSSKPYSGRRFRSSIWTDNLLGCKRGKN